MTDSPKRRADDRRRGLIKRIVAAARQQKNPLRRRRDLDEFIDRYHANVPVDDLDRHPASELASAALSHLALAERRRRGQAKLRIYNPEPEQDGWNSTHTVIELVNDDMPFLVDSVTMAVERAGLGVHLTVHPVITTQRKTAKLTGIGERRGSPGQVESFIRVEVDRISFRSTVKRLESEIRRTLGDVRAAVTDWAAMRDQMCAAATDVGALQVPEDPTLASESASLLEWMVDNHFTFLGFQSYRLRRRKSDSILIPETGTGLGIINSTRHDASNIVLSEAMLREALSPNPLIITKANSRSTIHRSSYLDYVGVKRFDDTGKVIGELRFLGLFTSLAYSESPRNIPLLRLKVHRVLTNSGLDPNGHRGKALAHILDNYPRDELLQSSIDDLTRTTSTILGLQDRRQVRLFLRRDTFQRFVSCLVYVPKEKYNTRIRLTIEQILCDAFGGSGVESSVEISDSALARLHSIVRTDTAANTQATIEATEARIAAAIVTWQDNWRDALVAQFGEEDGLDYFDRYADAPSLAYQEDIAPREAARDSQRVERCLAGSQAIDDRFALEPIGERDDHALVFKVFAPEPFALSDALPVLENLGVRVLNERPYRWHVAADTRFSIQAFTLEANSEGPIDACRMGSEFAATFAAVVAGDIENDGFNRLVLAAELTANDVMIIRAYAKYLTQLGLPFSQSYMETVLASNIEFVKTFRDAFQRRFNPHRYTRGRRAALANIMATLLQHVDNAPTVDADRILRAFATSLAATVRTNAYQDRPAAALALKLMPQALDEAPEPRPMFEIFVYSPRVEGVHLRAGEVARGGLRWSDRREDFRTEILGLMKAQTVKNTVIVPTGAKGGFVCKRLPAERNAVREEVVTCYQMFVGALLDVTDNVAGDKIVAPADTIRYDKDDPYLVVAADKGTAAFSDTANALSQERGFWLDDAFASGGSAGYDHKKMGITARGAWEAVKRHFREMGVDTQRQAFDVLAVGDMGGDVFGNGMLLSKKIRLRAAFNHLHIFLDPDPDTAASFRERRRLFKAEASGWDAYDSALISAGGGVYSRSDKRIPLSPAIRQWLATDETSLAPEALIHRLLKAPVDLFWNGGIGTYVKASSESHADAGDRANNALRVNATELGCRVVGEGGNLGLTQKARIEFAQAGGKINTDFIDNSAGVDSSDREVNIKILLGRVATKRRLPRNRRNKLLADMTDSVAALVLRNNYLQTQAISMVESRAPERLREHVELMRRFEGSGLLNRTLESMPDEESIKERSRSNHGLTRPELAVLLSYAKIELFNSLIGRSIVRQNYHVDELAEYFPPPLPTRYRDHLLDHRLSHQILVMRITNSIVNRMGPAFANRMQQDTGANAVDVARAYAIVRDITQARDIWARIEAMDNRIAARHQYGMMYEVSRRLRHASYWLLRQRRQGMAMDAGIAEFGPPLTDLYGRLSDLVPNAMLERHNERVGQYCEHGVGGDLAEQIAALAFTTTLLDIVDIARKSDELLLAGEVYFELDQHLSIDWLKQAIERLTVTTRWQSLARSKLRDTVNDTQRELARALLRQAQSIGASDSVAAWSADDDNGVAAYRETLRAIRRDDQTDHATLSVAVAGLTALLHC